MQKWVHLLNTSHYHWVFHSPCHRPWEDTDKDDKLSRQLTGSTGYAFLNDDTHVEDREIQLTWVIKYFAVVVYTNARLLKKLFE